MKDFKKNIFTELRVIESEAVKVGEAPEALYLKYLINDLNNLAALGYKLTKDGILKLKHEYKDNISMEPLYAKIMKWEPEVKADPMYPGFPTQVLKMDEKEFRLHQDLHYLSTYGLEIMGFEAQPWLPKFAKEERVEDVTHLELKTLEYLDYASVERLVIEDLVGRKERLIGKELEIAKAVALKTDYIIYEIPFKENIFALYGEAILSSGTRERAIAKARVHFKHVGDVLDFVEELIVLNKYKHFSTSVKRQFVQIIESFDLSDIEENLASNRWSNRFLGKKGKARQINRNIMVLDYLSYTRFSWRKEVQEIVKDLKDGKLLSWNQKLEQAYAGEDFLSVRKLLKQRPGIYFRQVNRLVGVGGTTTQEVLEDLAPFAKDLKTQSIVSTLNNYSGGEGVVDVFKGLLLENLKGSEIDELAGKRVFLDESDVDYSLSKIIIDKFEEGGYIRNGIAIKIPTTANVVSFFTYWNDKERIDIDLHGVSVKDNNIKHHIGWNGSYNVDYAVHSGDITHSDASEYINIDIKEALNNGIEKFQFNINSYTTKTFDEIEEVFTGLTFISSMDSKWALDNPKNVVFRHDLNYKLMSVDYAQVDLKNRVVHIIGKHSDSHNDQNFEDDKGNLSTREYLEMLVESQGGVIVHSQDNSDITLGLAKQDKENYISLIDVNYFM